VTPGDADRFVVDRDARSHFAWLRTRLSLERTLMAWVRTAVSLFGSPSPMQHA
jgi:putative membrane protein